jgi:hypothetical protein
MTPLIPPPHVAKMPPIWGNIVATPPGHYNPIRIYSFYIKNIEQGGCQDPFGKEGKMSNGGSRPGVTTIPLVYHNGSKEGPLSGETGKSNQFTIIAIMRRTKIIQLLIDYLAGVKMGYFKNTLLGEKSGFCPIWISFWGLFLSFIIDLRSKFIIKIPSVKEDN